MISRTKILAIIAILVLASKPSFAQDNRDSVVHDLNTLTSKFGDGKDDEMRNQRDMINVADSAYWSRISDRNCQGDVSMVRHDGREDDVKRDFLLNCSVTPSDQQKRLRKFCETSKKVLLNIVNEIREFKSHQKSTTAEEKRVFLEKINLEVTGLYKLKHETQEARRKMMSSNPDVKILSKNPQGRECISDRFFTIQYHLINSLGPVAREVDAVKKFLLLNETIKASSSESSAEH